MEHDGLPDHGARHAPRSSQKYDYEIAFEDTLIGELLDALDKTGLAKTTTVVVMSDHGEAFGVHTFAGKQMFFHGQTLYRELLARAADVPRARARRRAWRDDVVAADRHRADDRGAVRRRARRASWQGRSLVPALAGKPLRAAAGVRRAAAVPKWKHEAQVDGHRRRHAPRVLSDQRLALGDLRSRRRIPTRRRTSPTAIPTPRSCKQQLASWMEGPLARGRQVSGQGQEPVQEPDADRRRADRARRHARASSCSSSARTSRAASRCPAASSTRASGSPTPPCARPRRRPGSTSSSSSCSTSTPIRRATARQHTVSTVFIARARGHAGRRRRRGACHRVRARRAAAPLVFDHAPIVGDYVEYRRSGLRPPPKR